jgi:hypothetical protein
MKRRQKPDLNPNYTPKELLKESTRLEKLVNAMSRNINKGVIGSILSFLRGK